MSNVLYFPWTALARGIPNGVLVSSIGAKNPNLTKLSKNQFKKKELKYIIRELPLTKSKKCLKTRL